jgi:autotransporter passenger strand-loop-strand repeat protein
LQDGYVFAAAGATLDDAAVDGGADEVGGSASGTVVGSGGTELLLAGGKTVSAIVAANGVEYVAGSASGVTVQAGGYLFVASGGSAAASVLETSGYAYAAVGATLSGTIDSGVDEVAGIANSTTIGSGGTELVFGSAVGAIVGGGGVEEVIGSASAVTVSAGGYALILSGGDASGTTLDGGGFAYVAGGGTAADTIISGGTLDLATGGLVGSAPATFAGTAGGTLLLQDSMQFAGLVAGFGGSDGLDLADIPYAAGTTTFQWTQTTAGASASGTLSVNEGGAVANIVLLGQFAQTSFALQSGGFGGTLVTAVQGATATTSAGQIATPQHT